MSRSGVRIGNTISLRTITTDSLGELVSTDVLPQVYIYDASVDTETMLAEIEALTFDSAIEGPVAPTLLTAGFYELEYEVPVGEVGTWRDVWIADIEGVSINDYLTFVVTEGGVLTTQVLSNNELITIELDSTIANLAEDKTLGEDITITWATTISPLYASPDLIRLEAGPWIEWLPDLTLAIYIHIASKEADYISGLSGCSVGKCNIKNFNFARMKFVTFDAALRALLLPGGYTQSLVGSAANASGQKSLGDLSINLGSSRISTSSGVDQNTLDYLRKQKDDWWAVVNAGGCIVPGQGQGPTYAVRGICDPDRKFAGRLWLNPDAYGYAQPSPNTKVLLAGHRRTRFAHIPRSGRRW